MSKTSWQAIAVLVARVIFAGLFAMGASFKIMDMRATATFIGVAGFPAPLLLAWLALACEILLALCLLTGAYFAEACLFAAAYVLFLAIAFHGPAHWAANQDEFGFFVDHFTFIAGLLFGAVKGPGPLLAIHRTVIGRY